MKGRTIPDSVQSRLRALLEQHRAKPARIPTVGDCFFVDAPTLYPEDESDHVLLAAVQEAPSEVLICLDMSTEYWEASDYDYLLDPAEWTGGYSAIVEAWNPILIDPAHMNARRIHGEIRSDILDEIRALFQWHQAGQSPPEDFLAVGRPLPDDESGPRWQFRAREAALMERVRRHLHEGWDVANVLPFPKKRVSPKAKEREMRAAAAACGLTGAIALEFEAAKKDALLLEWPQGSLFLRKDAVASGYSLLWYSPEGHAPPEVKAQPPLGEGEAVPVAKTVQIRLGTWSEEDLRQEIILDVVGYCRALTLRILPKG